MLGPDEERIHVTGDEVRVSYDIRDLFKDIKKDLEGIRDALSAKADQDDVKSLQGRVRRLELWRAGLAGGLAVAFGIAGVALDLAVRHFVH